MLAQALQQGLSARAHTWGNPGRIKDIVACRDDGFVIIPDEVVDPGYHPRYNFANCEVMRRRDVGVADFLQRDVALLKLYNTYFRRTSVRSETVAEFLAGGTLLANLFLHLEANLDYWLAQVEELMAEIG